MHNTTESSNKPKTYNFSAIVEKRNSHDIHRFGCVRILLREVRLNGNLLFRDHVWVKDDKRTSKLGIGDHIHFTAKISPYIDVDNIKSKKLGLVNLRNIKCLYKTKKFKMNNEDYIPRTKLKKDLRRYFARQEKERAVALANKTNLKSA